MQPVFPIAFDKAIFTPLDVVPNPSQTDKLVQIIDPEFSSVCPKTGLPDYGRVILRYIPNANCVELKAWKLYLRSFYGVGIFHEAATQAITEQFVKVVFPKWVNITVDWGARGGLHTTTSVTWDMNEGYIASVDKFQCDVFLEHSKNWHNM